MEAILPQVLFVEVVLLVKVGKCQVHRVTTMMDHIQLILTGAHHIHRRLDYVGHSHLCIGHLKYQ